jgi:nucleotide-binding universal stress UspA family protein
MRLRHVLVAALVDEAETRPALALAGELARRAGSSLTLLGVARAPDADLAEAAQIPAADLERLAAASLREELTQLAARAELEARVEVAVGVPFVEVIRAALREGCDLVVAPAGTASEAGIAGGTLQHLLRKCPLPVWAVRGDSVPPARIAAAIDAEPEAQHRALDRRVVAAALALAELFGSELQLLHAFAPLLAADALRYRASLPETEVAGVLDAMRAKRRAWLGELLAAPERGARAASLQLLEGEPQSQIPRHVAREEIDLLVLGTLGRSGVAGLLIGNTAEAILRRVGCSVLALKPDGFESPVALP